MSVGQNRQHATRMYVDIKSRAKRLWANIPAIPEPVSGFLETSTLHGLVYISKAESMWGRILWTVSVLLSLSLAVLLINNSFQDWSAQPVSSVIYTH